MKQKFTEVYTGWDNNLIIHRIHDGAPTSQYEYVVIGGREIRAMAKAEPDLRNKHKYFSDEDVPILWYACGGGIVDQKNILLNEVIPDLFMSKLQNKAQILWIPTHEARINTSFEPDVMEILDAVTKIKEFNLFQETTFKIGLAKSWMGWGEECDEENLRVEHLNLAIEVIAYYMVKCRSLNLTKFTTTNTTVNKKNLVRCRVETHSKFWMDPSQ